MCPALVDDEMQVELSGLEYPGIIAKVDEPVELSVDGKLGECSTKHFAMRVGTSELPISCSYPINLAILQLITSTGTVNYGDNPEIMYVILIHLRALNQFTS